MIFLLLNGLEFPKISATFGFIYAFGSLLKGIGYSLYGPSARHLGGVIAHLGDLPL